jgi:hypothetical protein
MTDGRISRLARLMNRFMGRTPSRAKAARAKTKVQEFVDVAPGCAAVWNHRRAWMVSPNPLTGQAWIEHCDRTEKSIVNGLHRADVQ